MSNITYNIRRLGSSSETVQTLRPEDSNVSRFVNIRTEFKSSSRVELYIYDARGRLIESETNFNGINVFDRQGNTIKNVYIDPLDTLKNLGYEEGDITLHFNFIDDITTDRFFVDSISDDRTELRAATIDDIQDISYINDIIDDIENSPNFPEYKISLGDNRLYLVTKVNISNGKLYLKLYSPLSSNISKGANFSLIEQLSEPVRFSVESIVEPDPEDVPKLRGPNFDLESSGEFLPPTEYLEIDDLYNYPVNNTFNKVLTMVSSSGVDLNIDYSNYSEFIHFSSAKERLNNFKHKLEKLQTGDDITTKNIISKFDSYERHLYFNSGSTSWPKKNSKEPYENYEYNSSQGISFFNSQSVVAEQYDNSNESRIYYTTPEFIRDDDRNEPYNIFMDMIGQHFDNLWVYAKAITKKYDADNRLNYGISKDLIEDTLKNFGVKLYSSNYSTNSIFSSFVGEFYDTGSEQINTFEKVSENPVPDNDVLGETYKRIYHNLPYLLKTKGTKRGIRALINCFGIPDASLKVREYGGHIKSEPLYYGYGHKQDDKIRLDNTGSIVEGDTISKHTSIVKDDNKYTYDLHTIEVGFSPSYSVNDAISGSLESYYLDQFIGDPRHKDRAHYPDLDSYRQYVMSNFETYDVFDFIRLIKFFDNQIFKMISDFIPARSRLSTGIIIKPHYLERNKYERGSIDMTRTQFNGDIDTAFITSSNGWDPTDEYSTQYVKFNTTGLGVIEENVDGNEPKFNGEFGNSNIVTTSGELNDENKFKKNLLISTEYNVVTVGESGLTTLPANGNIIIESRSYDIDSSNTINNNIGFN